MIKLSLSSTMDIPETKFRIEVTYGEAERQARAEGHR